MMRYYISHSTTYQYQEPVVTSHHRIHLRPQHGAQQQLLRFRLAIDPEPQALRTVTDYFHNTVYYAELHQPYRKFSITAESIVSVNRTTTEQLSLSDRSLGGIESGMNLLHAHEALAVRDFRIPTNATPNTATVQQFARDTIGIHDDCQIIVETIGSTIFKQFQFDADATNVGTPIDDVLHMQRGVCQDFSHVMIAALRSLGIPARYVSGYIETKPAPGRERLRGADASHAWVEAWIPGTGWLGYDPTNGCQAGDQHIVVAYGRDYQDVSPDH